MLRSQSSSHITLPFFFFTLGRCVFFSSWKMPSLFLLRPFFPTDVYTRNTFPLTFLKVAPFSFMKNLVQWYSIREAFLNIYEINSLLSVTMCHFMFLYFLHDSITFWNKVCCNLSTSLFIFPTETKSPKGQKLLTILFIAVSPAQYFTNFNKNY